MTRLRRGVYLYLERKPTCFTAQAKREGTVKVEEIEMNEGPQTIYVRYLEDKLGQYMCKLEEGERSPDWICPILRKPCGLLYRKLEKKELATHLL